MIGSTRVGERRLEALIDEFGSETTHAAVEAVLDGAERQARAMIAGWPDGEYEGVKTRYRPSDGETEPRTNAWCEPDHWRGQVD